MFMQSWLFAKKPFTLRVPTPDEKNSPPGFFIREQDPHRRAMCCRGAFRELAVKRVNQFFAVGLTKVHRKRRVFFEKSSITRCLLFQCVDVRPDRTPLFSKLNVIVPLSVEPFAGDPHFVL